MHSCHDSNSEFLINTIYDAHDLWQLVSIECELFMMKYLITTLSEDV